MTTLRVVVDPMVSPTQGGIGRFTEELTRNLILTAPKNCDVVGIAAANPQEKLDDVSAKLPGLSELTSTTLPRRELAAAWQLGIAPTLATGLIHSPTLLAPLVKHDTERDGTQLTVTVHDTLAWSHPKSLTPTTVAWQKAMLKRARKHADAIVVPTHAVAQQLSEIANFGDRIRVIGAGVAESLRLPENQDARAAELGLPDQYILTLGTLDPRRGITSLIAGLGLPEAPDLPLLVLGPDSWGDLTLTSVADEAGLPEGRVRALGQLSDGDLALVLDRATLFVYPSVREGFGLPLIEAFSFGLPVVHSDDAALVEVAGGAGIVVESGNKGYAERLVAGINSVFHDGALRERLSVLGNDRAKSFSWHDSAERIWALHADI